MIIDDHLIEGIRILSKHLNTPRIQTIQSRYVQEQPDLVVYQGKKEIGSSYLVMIRHDQLLGESAIRNMCVFVDDDVILHFTGIVTVRLINKVNQGFVIPDRYGVFTMTYNPMGGIIKNSEVELHIFNTPAQAVSYLKQLKVGRPLIPEINVGLDGLRQLVHNHDAKKKRTRSARKSTMKVAPAAGGKR